VLSLFSVKIAELSEKSKVVIRRKRTSSCVHAVIRQIERNWPTFGDSLLAELWKDLKEAQLKQIKMLQTIC
jgi:hypothetical protein